MATSNCLHLSVAGKLKAVEVGGPTYLTDACMRLDSLGNIHHS
jgi:hypothetical protein